MTTILKRLRRRIYHRIPEWMRNNDFELFTATLCILAGLPLLLTDQVDATSIEATLPMALVKAWSAMLTLAPVAVGVGLWKSTPRPISKATFWLRLEAWGLRALAYAAYIYLLAIFAVNGLTTLPAMSIIAVFALTCHSRATGVTLAVEDFLQAIGTTHARH